MDKYIRHYVVSFIFLKHKLEVVESRLTTVNGEMTSNEDIPRNAFDEDKAFSDALKNNFCVNNIKEGYSVSCQVYHILPQTINPEWFNEQQVKSDEP